MIVFHVDNAPGANAAYYRIGWNVDVLGKVASWSSPINIPGWWGSETQGAGATWADLTGNARPDVILLNVDNPSGANQALYASCST
jgi:hypothetical protein